VRAVPLLLKAAGDANAAALDKGLDAVLSYLGCAGEAAAARWVPASAQLTHRRQAILGEKGGPAEERFSNVAGWRRPSVRQWPRAA